MGEDPVTCSRCGSDIDVVPVTYRTPSGTVRETLCPACKRTTLVRTRISRVRAVAAPKRLLVGGIAAVILVIVLTIANNRFGHDEKPPPARCVASGASSACVYNPS